MSQIRYLIQEKIKFMQYVKNKKYYFETYAVIAGIVMAMEQQVELLYLQENLIDADVNVIKDTGENYVKMS